MNKPTIEYAATDVTLFAAPFGFGPLGKAMALAHKFKDRGYTVKVLTDEVGLKIVKASGLDGDTYVYKQTMDLADLNTDLAISCMDISTPIIKSGVPLVLFDSLIWLRGSWEHLPKYNEDIYIAQRFFTEPPEVAVEKIKDHLHMVDAVLPESSTTPHEIVRGDKVVLYPGGLKSPHLPLEYQEQYLGWVIEAILPALERNDISLSNFTVILPPQILDTQLAADLQKKGVEIKSKQKDLGAIIGSAKAFIIAPGIETMLEGTAQGKVPLYLPAYIAPHIPQLVGLRKAGVGIELCPSYNDTFMTFEANGENMGVLSKDMLHYNQKELYQDKYQQEVTYVLDEFLKLPRFAQNPYPLGKNGADQVVDILEPVLDFDFFDEKVPEMGIQL